MILDLLDFAITLEIHQLLLVKEKTRGRASSLTMLQLVGTDHLSYS